jgi:hypothetical protein
MKRIVISETSLLSLPAMWEAEVEGLWFSHAQAKMGDPTGKITKTKRAGGLSQVGDHQSINHKVLSSTLIPCTHKNQSSYLLPSWGGGVGRLKTSMSSQGYITKMGSSFICTLWLHPE